MSKNNILNWGEKEIEYLRTHYMEMTYEEMARELRVSTGTILNRCHEYGFRRPKLEKIDWNEERLSYLREHFPNESASDIADKMGISCSSVSKKAQQLGLKKSPEWSKQLYRDRYIRNYKHTA